MFNVIYQKYIIQRINIYNSNFCFFELLLCFYYDVIIIIYIKFNVRINIKVLTQFLIYINIIFI